MSQKVLDRAIVHLQAASSPQSYRPSSGHCLIFISTPRPPEGHVLDASRATTKSHSCFSDSSTSACPNTTRVSMYTPAILLCLSLLISAVVAPPPAKQFYTLGSWLDYCENTFMAQYVGSNQAIFQRECGVRPEIDVDDDDGNESFETLYGTYKFCLTECENNFFCSAISMDLEGNPPDNLSDADGWKGSCQRHGIVDPRYGPEVAKRYTYYLSYKFIGYE
jgi:hypothetical protein